MPPYSDSRFHLDQVGYQETRFGCDDFTLPLHGHHQFENNLNA